MNKIIFLVFILFSSFLTFGQAVGTPYIFQNYKAPYVYQNFVTSYDCSTLTGWTGERAGYGSVIYQLVDNSIGNPSPSIKNNNTSNSSIFRDFGQNFKNKTIEFDIRIEANSKAGFIIGAPLDGSSGLGLTMKTAGTPSGNGLNYSNTWWYTNNGGDSYTFNPGEWYAIKIITDDGIANGTKWYVNGILVGNNSTNLQLSNNNTYFSYTCEYGISYIDNIKITY